MSNILKVTLIRPPYVIPMKSIYGHRGVPPLGLVYLSAAIKSIGHEVTCIDGFGEHIDNFQPIEDTDLLTNGLTTQEIIERIPKDTEVIGISCMFSNEWINTSRVVREVKKAFPQTFMVLGGEHVTADYVYILQNYPEVDCCTLGEGEEKTRSLIRELSKGNRDLSTIPGVTYLDRTTNQIKTTDTAYRVKDINTIAPPDWHSIPLHNYLDQGLGMSMQGKRSIPMLLSRGCPYRCTFCSNENMWTTKWVSRDIDEVIKEIKYNISTFRIEHIDFFDLTAIVNRSWTIEFCKRMIQENFGITWSLPSGTRSEALDEEVLKLLWQSGCNKITYAPESGSDEMTKLIKKRVNLKKMLSSMKVAVKTGLIVKSNIIFGFPDERYRDILLNFVFLFKMAFVGVHDVPCFGFTPYPGSALFNRLLSEGKIKRDKDYYRFLAHLVYSSPMERLSWSEKLPNWALPMLSLGGMAFFYSCQFIMRPWRFALLVKNVLKNSPRTMLEIAFWNMKNDFILGKRLQNKK